MRKIKLGRIFLLTCLLTFSILLWGESLNPLRSPSPILKTKKGGFDRVYEKLKSSDPEEAIQILKNYGRARNIKLEEIPLLEKNPNYSVKFPNLEFIPSPGVCETLMRKIESVAKRETFSKRIPLILQFKRRLSLKEMMELYQLGIKGLTNSLNKYTCVVTIPVKNFSSLLQKPFIRSILEYKPSYKLKVPYSGINKGLIIPIDYGRPEYEEDLKDLGIEIITYIPSTFTYYVKMTEEQGEAVTRLWWVLDVAFMQPVELEGDLNFEPDDSRELISAFESPATGEGVTVGVLDRGVWKDHPDFAPKEETFVGGNIDEDSDGHGTHVCGIIAGRGTRDIEGEYDARGVAPGARLDVVGGDATFIDAYNEFVSRGVQISNHSWCFTILGLPDYFYDSNAQQIDEYIDNDDMIWVISAGNFGPGSETITNPATGKNVISVGAIRYVSDSALLERELGGTAIYSSRGPTYENKRLKPEIMAPGGQTDGDYGYYKFGVVSCNSFYEGDWTDTSLNQWTSDEYYTRMSGTSQAAPHVTGVLALMKETFPNLTSEAAKARLIAGTIPIEYSAGDNPNNGYASTESGFGLVNAFHASGYYYPGDMEEILWVIDNLDYSNSQDTYNFQVPEGTQQLVAVMAYNDHSPNDTGAIYSNLDLSLYHNGTLINYEEPEGVTAEGTVEKIIVENPEPGDWSAIVTYQNPGIFDNQDYSLYVMAILKRPQLNITSVSINGVSYSNGDSLNVSPGKTLTVVPTIVNSGGWIAAGVTARVSISSDSCEEILGEKFVGNLIGEGSSKSISFDIETPSESGDYTLQIYTQAINKGLPSASFSLTLNVSLDTDQDGLPDWWENEYFGTLDYGPDDDPDNDGLTNLEEYNLSTHPANPDTDGDGLPDGWEVNHGLDPNDSTGDNGAEGDPDNDGYTNLEEYQGGSDPKTPSSIPQFHGECELEIKKDKLLTLEEYEHIKELAPSEYYPILDEYISAVESGKDTSYRVGLWLDLDIEANSATLSTPDGVTYNLTPDEEGGFNLEIDKIYFSLSELKNDFPPGKYTITVVPSGGGPYEISTTIMPDYDTSDFPSYIEGSIIDHGIGQNMELEWDTVPDSDDEYEIKVQAIDNKVVYDIWESGNIFLSHPNHSKTLLPGTDADMDFYYISMQAEKDITHGDFRIEFSSYISWCVFRDDLDHDSLPDWWENQYFGTLDYGPDDDPDNDGLTNLEEYYLSTHPANPDTDGDGLPDSWEVNHDLDPNDSTGDNGAEGDPDNDGYTNLEEYQGGSDPKNEESVPSTHFQPVAYTSTWVNFYGTVKIFGENAEPGDEVGAFIKVDGNEICIGAYKITEDDWLEGENVYKYGFMPVYGDDDTTPEKDGADSGDTIIFKIWDASEQKEYVATALGPDEPIWTHDGDQRNVNLDVVSAQIIPLHPGWNLVSFSVNNCYYDSDNPPDVPLLPGVNLIPVDDLGDVFVDENGNSFIDRIIAVRGFSEIRFFIIRLNIKHLVIKLVCVCKIMRFPLILSLLQQFLNRTSFRPR